MTEAQQVFEENTQRATSLQKTLEDYVERYKKLTPLLQLINQDLELKLPPKQEPQVKPPIVPSSNTLTNNSALTPNAASAPAPKKAPQRKRTYTKKNQVANNNNSTNGMTPHNTVNAPIMPNSNGGGSYQAGSMLGFNSFQPNKNPSTEGNGSENQPILL